jgi:predicted transcriptional regulator
LHLKKGKALTPPNRQAAIFFTSQLRKARLATLADAEAFDEIIHVLEKLGSYLTREAQRDVGCSSNLGQYEDALGELASHSGMADDVPSEFRSILTPFKTLFQSVRVARNDAMHQGAFARHLARHAVQLAIILEDALAGHSNFVVTDFMIRNVVYAELWQPIGFIRQQMLENSFTCLPVLATSDADRGWQVVSDIDLAAFLRQETRSKDRVKLLAHTLQEAKVNLRSAKFVDEKTSLDEALELLKTNSIVLVAGPSERGLLGILTAFDLM